MIGGHREDELQSRFETALSEWDSHIGSCTGCLRHGNALCEDGYYLSGDVMQARAALEAIRQRLETTPTHAALVSGVPA